ncbi:MAG: class I SAM-dependent methyltransferase [Actinobacteria bacterium]|nr:MAG: class I SAM-dependent methyltransferase [Actinomycetota bacterium]
MGRRDRQAGTFSSPLFSRFLYPRFKEASIKHGEPERRRRLLDGVTGKVIEIGAGDGMNIDYYPPSVNELLAVEPEDTLRAKAAEKAPTAPFPVRVEPGFADRLPAEDDSFDVAVCSLVLCSVDDQGAALAEIQRVLRPSGELRFYEHVRGHTRALIGAQHLITPVWSRLGGGCHINRDTETAIEQTGFTIGRIDRFVLAPSLLDRLGGDHIMGVARA